MLPVLYQWKNFTLYSYPLLMGIAWGVGYQFLENKLSKKVTPFLRRFFFIGLILFSWIGAKVFFLLTSYQDKMSEVPFTFWLGGGFVFYGGLFGGGLFLFLFLRNKNKFDYLDALIPALLLGHGIGRLGCFLAGCCYGRPTTFFLSVHLHGQDRYPTQLFESLGLFFIFGLINKFQWKQVKMLSSYFFFYGLLRFIVEIFRGDTIRGSWGMLSPGSWISVVLILMGVLFYFHSKKRPH